MSDVHYEDGSTFLIREMSLITPKLKPQFDTIAHLTGWLKLKKKLVTIPNTVKDPEDWITLTMIKGINGAAIFGKQLRSLLEK